MCVTISGGRHCRCCYCWYFCCYCCCCCHNSASLFLLFLLGLCFCPFLLLLLLLPLLLLLLLLFLRIATKFEYFCSPPPCKRIFSQIFVAFFVISFFFLLYSLSALVCVCVSLYRLSLCSLAYDTVMMYFIATTKPKQRNAMARPLKCLP